MFGDILTKTKKESITIMDLRYPIGHFTYEETITHETIENWIKQIENLPTELTQAIKDLNTTQLDTPYDSASSCSSYSR